MLMSEIEFITRYGETDQMGIIHHSSFPLWFEAGRTDFFKKLGIPYSKIEEGGILLPLVGLKCSFKSPARYEDEIIVRTRPLNISCVRLSFCYEVFKKDGMVLIATGETSHGWTDKTLKPVNIQKKLPSLFFHLNEAVKVGKIAEL